MKKLTKDDLQAIKQEELKKETANWIKVGLSTCGIAAGAQDIYDFLVEEVKKRNLGVSIQRCGCAGMCYAEPLIEVKVEGMPKVFYGKVNKETAMKIVEKHIGGKILVNDHIYDIRSSQ
ncbi:MAG: hypothetical protein A3G33_07950 [Omnitrophica bacterium RIFCSPLOWO2_12_FULL_44_17]|uniref:NADP oxidoreductase n=1 Tax=Candidatus Danuiimicrobium aquiferis TaxID=1801832 RepID=A0A1G1L305_9BACT|nr:MAG: hypothetical protein A3B72_05730 [Omnitrophica bacterium RIFCSPHIGHO2_02_FULL_45_28]OGW91823.1 MAG: hypothetical protein A3E74_00030 [Omnitrophica bacterium RIFCSPHIGHO2_12_FULL_44_12]OGW99535.1 MAG: hypothetical protein A3G33_07950 [Omnitrophica bacterium RIFCSPLOWO2_12_FULL_44_17]OGX02706.1 MAG: hypothetical protein A3J12_06940 [Omnitrophica bacterium RIFCSPLOWO2_02_FULL_44_11]